MQCPLGLQEGGELVVGYAARTLDSRAQVAFERHLKSCGVCAEAVAAQQALWQALDQWRSVDVSADFDRRLRSHIARDRNWWRRCRRPAMPVIAAGIVFAVAAWRSQPPAVDVTAPVAAQASAANASGEIEKLEHALDDIDLLSQLSPI